MIGVRRVYDAPGEGDGYRVLVDRLWPRGIRRAAGGIDLWMRDIAPSTELRNWFGHQVERWPAFHERYATELESHGPLLDLLKDIEQHHGTLTLLYGARDEEHNEARVLAEVLAARPTHAHH